MALSGEFDIEQKLHLTLQSVSLFSDQEQEKIDLEKKVPRWSYKLITELEQQSEEYKESVPEDHEISSRRAKRVVILTDNDKEENTDDDDKEENTDPNTNNTNNDINPPDSSNEGNERVY